MYCEFRGDTLYLANALHPNGIGVEVGVHKGEFSAQAVGIWPTVSKYYMVDEWRDDFDPLVNPDLYFNSNNKAIHENVVNTFQSPYCVLRESSANAAKKLQGNSWVYLDNNHTFSHVHEEIKDWWDTLVPNGILAGHDYDVTGYRPGFPIWAAVPNAVQMWAKDTQRPIYTSVDRQDWWTINSDTPQSSDLVVISDSHTSWPSREIIIENHKRYCDHWGYEYRHECQIMPGYHGPWAKVQGILNCMDSTDKKWICWLDADLVVTDYSESQHKHCHYAFQQVLGAFRNHWHPNGGPNTSRWLLQNTEYNKNILKRLLTMRHWFQAYCHEENALDELVYCRANENFLLIDSNQWSLDPQWMRMHSLTFPSACIHVPNGNGKLRHGIIKDLCTFSKSYNKELPC